jgi:hypothetical protein
MTNQARGILRRAVLMNRSGYRRNQKRDKTKDRKYAARTHSSAKPYVHTTNYT